MRAARPDAPRPPEPCARPCAALSAASSRVLCPLARTPSRPLAFGPLACADFSRARTVRSCDPHDPGVGALDALLAALAKLGNQLSDLGEELARMRRCAPPPPPDPPHKAAED